MGGRWRRPTHTYYVYDDDGGGGGGDDDLRQTLSRPAGERSEAGKYPRIYQHRADGWTRVFIIALVTYCKRDRVNLHHRIKKNSARRSHSRDEPFNLAHLFLA